MVSIFSEVIIFSFVLYFIVSCYNYVTKLLLKKLSLFKKNKNKKYIYSIVSLFDYCMVSHTVVEAKTLGEEL